MEADSFSGELHKLELVSDMMKDKKHARAKSQTPVEVTIYSWIVSFIYLFILNLSISATSFSVCVSDVYFYMPF